MKLDRNIPSNRGRGKYAVIKMRALTQIVKDNGRLPPAIYDALQVLEGVGVLDYGVVGTPDEFFLIRLKDRFAQKALIAYANEAESFDKEYALEVTAMADRAGLSNPFCKLPDCVATMGVPADHWGRKWQGRSQAVLSALLERGTLWDFQPHGMNYAKPVTDSTITQSAALKSAEWKLNGGSRQRGGRCPST